MVAEYVALSHAMHELITVREILKEVNILVFESPILLPQLRTVAKTSIPSKISQYCSRTPTSISQTDSMTPRRIVNLQSVSKSLRRQLHY